MSPTATEKMEELLKQRNGQQIEVICRDAVCVIGEIIRIEKEVLHMSDGESLCFIALRHIVYFKDVVTGNKYQAGFGSAPSK